MIGQSRRFILYFSTPVCITLGEARLEPDKRVVISAVPNGRRETDSPQSTTEARVFRGGMAYPRVLDLLDRHGTQEVTVRKAILQTHRLQTGMNRRTALRSVAAGVTAYMTAGCLDIVFGNGVEVTADVAEPAAETLSETGYTLAESDELSIEETVEFGGQSRTVTANSPTRTYQRSIELGGIELEGGLFAVASLPTVAVAGRTFNPISDLSHAELLTRFGSELGGQYGSLENAEFEGEFQEPILEQETTVSKFLMTTTLQQREVDTSLYVATIDHNEDLIVSVGGHPQSLPEERARVIDLKRSLQHPVDP